MGHLTLLCIALLLAWSEAARGQAARDSAAGGAPGGLCYRARPKPGCSVFVLTNFGSYVVLGRAVSGNTPLRAVADWGLMVNVSARDAVGASVFVSADRDGFALGPELRYRRWMGRSESVELAVGAPLAIGGDNYKMETGSAFGLVKWSPNHWFAVAARPELIRGPVFLGCGPISCPGDEVRSRVRLSLGVEIGWVPGLAATPLGLLAMLFAAVASGGGN
jgi:hypothetical protein